MKIAIKIATYQRADGRTPFLLNRALESIKSQTYQDYKIFLIGDKYEDNEEFLNILSIIDSDKIYFENLPIAVERDKYTGGKLWSAGGVNALNHGITKAIEDGFDYICHLDHDDWWEITHLEEIVNAIKSDDYVIIATKSLYFDNTNKVNIELPKNSAVDNFLPVCGDLIHSSVCINFGKINIRYRDVFAETGIENVADGDMWDRLSNIMITNNLKGKLVNKVTCLHLEEGYSLR